MYRADHGDGSRRLFVDQFVTTQSETRDWASLARQIDGLRLDRSVRKKASQDFGGVVRRTPAAIVDARSSTHEQQVIEECRRLRIPLTIQGFGGSVNGQSLVGSGILLRRKEKTPAPVRFLDDTRVEISGRSRWWDVERRLHKEGMCIPVLADFLGLTVGGTLSVGGYGFDSIRHGAQVDQVERLSLIKPDGQIIQCSARENADLFSCALAGLGQIGLIDNVVVRTIPHTRYTVMYNFAHKSMIDMAKSFRWMANGDAGPDMFKGLYSRGRAVSTYGVGCGTLGEVSNAEPPVDFGRNPRRFVIPQHRFARSLLVSAWVASFGRASRMWVDYVLDYDGLLSFVDFLSTQIGNDAFGGYLKSVYILGIRRKKRQHRIPLEASGAISAPVAFGVGLYSMVPRSDQSGVDHLRAAHATMLEKCVALGGRPYLYGIHEFDENILRQIYGDDYVALQQLKAKLDPDGLFQARKLIDEARAL